MSNASAHFQNFVFDAMSKMLPEQGKDYLLDLKETGNYNGTVTFTYLTDLGALFAPYFEKHVNDAIRGSILDMKMDEASRQSLTKPSAIKFVGVELVDGRNSELSKLAVEEPISDPKLINATVPMTEALAGMTAGPDVKERIMKAINESVIRQLGPELAKSANIELKIDGVDQNADTQPDVIIADEEPAPKNNQPEEQTAEAKEAESGFEDGRAFDFYKEHWMGVLKAYLPNPDVAIFESWIARLIVIELNHMFVADKMKVLKMPEEFNESWLENVKVVFADPVWVDYTDLFSPTKFRGIVNNIYKAVSAANAEEKMYNGTVRLALRRTSSDLLSVTALYLTRKQSNEENA